jgi:hypothetical protein
MSVAPGIRRLHREKSTQIAVLSTSCKTNRIEWFLKMFRYSLGCHSLAEAWEPTGKGINNHIRFEKHPQQIKGDYVVLKKRGKALSGGRIGHFYEVD